MPSNSSIYRWTPLKHITAGFDENLLMSLQRKVEALDARGRQVSLIFDAMTIRPELNYNEYHDKIIGFQCLGDKQNPIAAKRNWG